MDQPYDIPSQAPAAAPPAAQPAAPVAAAQPAPPYGAPAPAAAPPAWGAPAGAYAQPQPAWQPPRVAAPPPAAPYPAPGFAPVLACEHLTKSFGARAALADVTFSVPAGRVVGLLGPNGSGKTTLIKLAAGLLTPTSGAVRVAGLEPGTRAKALLSYLPERPYFAPSMRVRDCVAFFADFYADFDQPLAQDMLARLGVPADSPMGTLSKGTKEKVQLVLVMARHAALYLLDEPIGGVDPATRDYILDTIIAQYHRDSTILISTHLIADVEAVLDDFIFLQYGTMVVHAPVAFVREQGYASLDDYFRRAFRC
ncbi:ABC transporter ATP-binding protein [Adlercreutzia faecimuris]|uniref:ABC transporter ATP-binding protein n=1 Tax=Adlercreutzia faecimuris TaxID=2897341 RepID=A0ABS9WHA7_9ACTN|nr:ABC transporter ATP-binding protein [Adlercreutzia sp. JBNU-10]MCI2242245.1 ABC transporter ATP-binding protein [Adlercreutzia sp. JBNU-10]